MGKGSLLLLVALAVVLVACGSGRASPQPTGAPRAARTSPTPSTPASTPTFPPSPSPTASASSPVATPPPEVAGRVDSEKKLEDIGSKLAARVRDMSYTQRDLVKRLRVIEVRTGGVDLGTGPFRVLFKMVEDELIRQGAVQEGVVVLETEVLELIRGDFSPVREPGSRDSLLEERQYQADYQAFLTEAGVTDKEYRALVASDLYRERFGQRLKEQVPSTLPHVEVHWVRLPSRVFFDPNNPPPEPYGIASRLETESFALVAQEVSFDPVFDGNSDGYIGWVPEGAFPELDRTLFGTSEQARIPFEQISKPITVQDATYIVKVTGGPEAREVTEEMRERLKETSLSRWVREEWDAGVEEGWLEVQFNSELYSWVVDQLLDRKRQ